LRVSQDLRTTSYVLLGMLVSEAQPSAHGLTGYELKQRADENQRFYWASPAMSQIYSELPRLTDAGLVIAASTRHGRRITRRYRATEAGVAALTAWLSQSTLMAPTLKHPVALRLLMGHLMEPSTIIHILESYVAQLASHCAELEAICKSLSDNGETSFPAIVAEWGLASCASEQAIADRYRATLANETHQA